MLSNRNREAYTGYNYTESLNETGTNGISLVIYYSQ